MDKSVPVTPDDAWTVLRQARDGEVLLKWQVNHAIIIALLDLKDKLDHGRSSD